MILGKGATFSPGDIVGVRYRADPALLHEILIIQHVHLETYMVWTPDGDVYPLVLSTPPLHELVADPSKI